MSSKAAQATIVIKAQDDTSATLDRIHTKLMGMKNPLGDLTRKLTNASNNASVKGLGDSWDRMNNKLASAGLGVGIGAAGLAVSAAGAFKSVVNTAEQADRIGDLGGRLNLNAEQFQVFEKLAKDGGASIEEMGGAFTKFRLNLQQAESEGGEKLAKMSKALGSFGLSFNEARAMQPLELAKKLGQISAESKTDADQELKLDRFRSLFGKTGATLIPVIESVGTSYDKTLEGMAKTGTLFSDAQVESASKAYKRWEKAQQAMQGLNRVFGLAMQPAFEALANGVYERSVQNREKLSPVFKAIGEKLAKFVPKLLDDLEKLAKKVGTVIDGIVWLSEKVGIGNIAIAAGALVVAPFAMALVGLGKEAFFAARAIANITIVPLAGWLAKTEIGLWAVNAASNVAWASFLGPLALIGAVAALVYVNIEEIGNYLTGMSKRVEQATDKAGVFAGIWQMIKEIACGAINAIIGTINTLGDLLVKMGLMDTSFGIKLIGPAGAGQASPAASVAASTIPATAPATSRQEVNGTVRVQLDKGLIPADVKSDNRSFNIDAIAGGMFAGNAL